MNALSRERIIGEERSALVFRRSFVQNQTANEKKLVAIYLIKKLICDSFPGSNHFLIRNIESRTHTHRCWSRGEISSEADKSVARE